MFKEILKIIPKLDNSDLNKMERALNSRFAKVSKKFLKGLGTGIMGGGIVGATVGLLERFLNPLKGVQESIDNFLSKSDDLATNAAQFNASSGELFKLTKYAQAAGLDQDALYMLINKFQTSVAEAEADPTKATSVRQYVGKENTVDAFFNFIQSLQKMSKNDQLLVQKEVFGEKQILKMADFLQQNFGDLTDKLRLQAADVYTAAVDKPAMLKDLTDITDARRDAQDTINKALIVNRGMVSGRDRTLRAELDQENYRMGKYKTYESTSLLMQKGLQIIERSLTEMVKQGADLANIADIANKLSVSRALKMLHGKGE